MADLTLVVATAEPNELIVLAEGRPTVCQALYPKSRIGEILRAEGEPLVSRCLKSGRLQRSQYACMIAGRPVEQVAVAVRDEADAVIAVLNIERTVLNGPWGPRRRPLREAATALSETLLQGAVSSRDVFCLVRMARGVAVTEPKGDILYADESAQLLWQKALAEQSHIFRLPSGAPQGATVLSDRQESWGMDWEFEVNGTVLRRRNIMFRPGRQESNVLTTIHDVSHLHAGTWHVSSRSAAVQEIHHRIKNNLQTISSLLRMQARRETSPEARESVRTAIARVQSVAFVHDALSRDGTDEVDLKGLASTIAEAALHGVQRAGREITYAVLGPRLLLPAAKASQVALVLNELIQNAIKHGFADGRGGSVTIRFDVTPKALIVTVRDDGIGLPEGFDLLKTRTLGLQITKTIVESDLGGTLELASDRGTNVIMTLPPTLVREGMEKE